MGSLFPCLPDELGLECLLRVEFNSHHNLRCVSKSWNSTLKSPQFYQERKRLKISEQRICLLYKKDGIARGVAVYDIEKNSCKILPPIPEQTNAIFACHFVKTKLVFIADWSYDSTRIGCTWLYDFCCSKWEEGNQMPGGAIGFASAADEAAGVIYVGGGCKSRNSVRSASVYNVDEDKWDILPDMNAYITSHSSGAFADGKFYVMSDPSQPTFQVFDSCTKSWKTLENRLKSWHLLSIFGRLHCLSDRGLIEYDYGQDKVQVVGLLPKKNLDSLYTFSFDGGHKFFLTYWDSSNGECFLILELPNETGGAIKWTEIERPLGIQGFIEGAVTLDL